MRKRKVKKSEEKSSAEEQSGCNSASDSACVQKAKQSSSSLQKTQSLEKTLHTVEEWNQDEQKQLEHALVEFPKGTQDRWIKIAKAIPGKLPVSLP